MTHHNREDCKERAVQYYKQYKGYYYNTPIVYELFVDCIGDMGVQSDFFQTVLFQIYPYAYVQK